MSFDAHVCPNGHVTYPGHTLCPECGEKQTETVDLSERTGEVVTWTHSTKTPPGVRAPNTLAIVQFDVSDVTGANDGDGTGGGGDENDSGRAENDGDRAENDGGRDVFVRAIGQVTSDDVETGDEVEPVYVEELRDPEEGIKVPESQDWDGYRFDPV